MQKTMTPESQRRRRIGLVVALFAVILIASIVVLASRRSVASDGGAPAPVRSTDAPPSVHQGASSTAESGARQRLEVVAPRSVTPPPASRPDPRPPRGAAIRGGAVAGRISSEHGSLRAVVALELQSLDDPTRRPAQTTLDDGGSFRFEGLSAGTYELVLRLWNWYPGSRTFPDIVVRDGETTEIETLRIEDLWHELYFTVLDEGGSPIPDASLAWRDGEAEPFIGLVPARDPEGRLLLRTFAVPVPEVRISASGWRSTTLELVRGDAKVFLQRGPAVRLVLTDGLPRLGEDWSLCARVAISEELYTAATFDATGVGSLHISEPGRFFVGLHLTHPRRRGFRMVNGLTWWIEVQDTDEEQLFLSPSSTQEFLDHLERHQAGPEDF